LEKKSEKKFFNYAIFAKAEIGRKLKQFHFVAFNSDVIQNPICSIKLTFKEDYINERSFESPRKWIKQIQRCKMIRESFLSPKASRFSK